MRYHLFGPDESPAEEGEATIAVQDRVLVVTPALGQPLRIRPTDIASVREAGPGALSIRLTSGYGLLLEQLGRLHGQILGQLVEARDDDLTETLLLVGVGRPESFPGALDGIEAQVRLYDDALVVIPRQGDPEQVPYSFVGDVVPDASGYRIEIRTLDERTLVVQRLARRTSEFLSLLRSRVSAARGRTGHLVDTLLPGLDALPARAVAAALADGVAASRERLDGVDPTVFPALVDSCTLPERLPGVAELWDLGELWFGLHQRTSVEQRGWSTGSGDAQPVGPRDHGEAQAAPGGLAGLMQGEFVQSMGRRQGGDGVPGAPGPLGGFGPGASMPGLEQLLAYRMLGGAAGGMLGGAAGGMLGAGGGAPTGRDARTPVPRAHPHQGRARAAWTELAALGVHGEAPTVLAFLFCRTPHGEVVYEVLNERDHATYVYRPGVAGVAELNQALALIGFRVSAITAEADGAGATHRRAVERLPYLRVLRDAHLGRVLHTQDWSGQLRQLLRG